MAAPGGSMTDAAEYAEVKQALETTNAVAAAEGSEEVVQMDVVEEEEQQQLVTNYMDVDAHDWHNRIRRAVLGLISAIPKVGGAASMLIGLFWPANRMDIFAAIKAEQYIRNIVMQEIFELEVRRFESQIEALHVTIERYERAATNEKGNFLSIWISQADGLIIELRRSPNDIHLLLHIVTVAVLHIAALHERMMFGEELYGSTTTTWAEDLVKEFKQYGFNLLPDVFSRWKEWRVRQIEIRAWIHRNPGGNLLPGSVVSHATVEDKLSGELFTFRRNNNSSTTIFSAICEDHKTRMNNQAIADMVSCISPTFGFHKLLPDDVRPQVAAYEERQFGQVFVGPYSEHLLIRNVTNIVNFRSRPTHFDQGTGRVMEVTIRAGSHIDAIQLWYAHPNSGALIPGTMAGFPQGGSRHQVDVRDRRIEALRMEFVREVLTAFQLAFDGGDRTQNFGNGNNLRTNAAVCTTPAGYRLSSWAFREDTGPYQSTAISVLRFQFTPDDVDDVEP